MIKRIQIQILFVFLLVVASFHFFEAKFLSKTVVFYLPFLFVVFAFAISIPFFFRKHEGFILPVQLIVLSMLVSIFIAYISRGQGIMDSILVTAPMMLWIFFFYLVRKEIPVHAIEKVILVYGVIYIILYFYQFAHGQKVLFGGIDEFRVERGVTRVIIPGEGIFILASFIALNKITIHKHGKWLWILMSIIGIIIPILTATRQFIAGVFLIYIFHLIKNQPFCKKVLIMVSIFILIFYIIRSDNVIVKGILEAQENTMEEREGLHSYYIRDLFSY